ncbi:MAG: hypothetical protein KKA05_10135 [Alphaproteobacteria bacterium]|nr:hypothetical protein [Alphaproteobacteria bacterium]
MLPFPDNRDAMLGKACARIEYYLRNEEKEGRIPPISILGMIDLIFEIDRRVRKGLGLFDIPVVGIPLAACSLGPYPPLIEKPLHGLDKGAPREGITQEQADQFTKAIYEKNGELMYAICELKRRLLRGGGVMDLLEQVVRSEIAASNDKILPVKVKGELMGRLSIMCQMPSYEQIKTLELKD